MERIIRLLFDGLLARLLQLVGTVLILSVLLQIISRFIMLQPFPWTEELARFSFIWFCFLGSAYTLRRNLHLGIDYYYLKFGLGSRRIIDIVVTSLIIIFGVLLVVLGMRMVGITGIQRSPIMRLRMSYMYAVLPVTGALYIIFSVYQLFALLKSSPTGEAS